jgi:hypothetical protein
MLSPRPVEMSSSVSTMDINALIKKNKAKTQIAYLHDAPVDLG